MTEAQRNRIQVLVGIRVQVVPDSLIDCTAFTRVHSNHFFHRRVPLWEDSQAASKYPSNPEHSSSPLFMHPHVRLVEERMAHLASTGCACFFSCLIVQALVIQPNLLP
jgi:hypothetical protein